MPGSQQTGKVSMAFHESQYSETRVALNWLVLKQAKIW
jgi:hypothetical protein